MKNEIKTVDAAGLAFITGLEGCILHPYRDSVGVCTISSGVTYYEDGRRVTMNDPWITMDRALHLFKNILSHYEKTVWSTTRDDINQNQFNSLTSFVYNVGATAFKGSKLLALVNVNPRDIEIRNAFLAWRFAGGKPILLGRRKQEASLYFLKN